jgi:hypothetical protein
MGVWGWSSSQKAFKRGELFARFALEDDGFGEEPVAETVAGGFAFAFGRGRPVGFGTVGSGCGDLFVSSFVSGHGG